MEPRNRRTELKKETQMGPACSFIGLGKQQTTSIQRAKKDESTFFLFHSDILTCATNSIRNTWQTTMYEVESLPNSISGSPYWACEFLYICINIYIYILYHIYIYMRIPPSRGGMLVAAFLVGSVYVPV